MMILGTRMAAERLQTRAEDAGYDKLQPAAPEPRRSVPCENWLASGRANRSHAVGWVSKYTLVCWVPISRQPSGRTGGLWGFAHLSPFGRSKRPSICEQPRSPPLEVFLPGPRLSLSFRKRLVWGGWRAQIVDVEQCCLLARNAAVLCLWRSARRRSLTLRSQKDASLYGIQSPLCRMDHIINEEAAHSGRLLDALPWAQTRQPLPYMIERDGRHTLVCLDPVSLPVVASSFFHSMKLI